MDERALRWQSVVQQRRGRWAEAPIIYRRRVDSTNLLAASLIPTQAPPGTAVVTDYQYAGRGRLARRWYSEPYSALTVTVVLGPFDPSWAAPPACGLAAQDAIESLGVHAVLKWPNDLLVAGKKCGGILLESHAAGTANWLLAGIGLNVRSVDPSLPAATYLDAHAPHAISREELLLRLLDRLDHWCALAVADSAALRSVWRSRLVTLGQRVTVQTPGTPFAGQAVDLSANGGLIVRLDDGSTRVVQAGDVTLSASYPV